MDRGSIAKSIAVLVVIGAGIFLYVGGWGWLFGKKGKPGPNIAQQPPDDPLHSSFAPYLACADGTYYVLTEDGKKVFWLVAGKAAAVVCPDLTDSDASIAEEESHADARGGLYVRGKVHLWYLYKGTANQVTEVPKAELSENDHRVTDLTVHWAALRASAKAAYEAGKTEGYGEGYDEGHYDPR